MLKAIALLLILEGLLPLFAPKQWRQIFSQLLTLRDGQLRFMGLISCAIGALIFLLVNQ